MNARLPQTSPDCSIRAATANDIDLILELINELAGYERLAGQVTATADQLRTALFGPHPCAEALIAETDAGPAGFALYFQNFSTFLCKPGIYLEDLFVRPAHRGKGIGLSLLKKLAAIAVERGCERLDWMVLDWNQTAIDFYEKLGATSVETFCPYRLSGDALRALAEST